MILAKDEVIVNEWEYATSQTKKVKTKHCLVVTNKRIVSTVESPRKLTQREIPVNSVQNVSVTHETPSKVGAVLSIIFGILFMIIGAMSLVLSFGATNQTPIIKYVMLGVGAVLLILGLIMMVLGIRNLNQGMFLLELSTNNLPEYELMSVGFDKIFGSRRVSSSVKLHIDNAVAKEIIDTLGAIIIDNK